MPTSIISLDIFFSLFSIKLHLSHMLGQVQLIHGTSFIFNYFLPLGGSDENHYKCDRIQLMKEHRAMDTKSIIETSII